MSTVKQLLESKAPGVWSIDPDRTVYQALEMLAEKDIGALVVVEGGRLVGMFSERDYARNVVLRGRASRDMPVRELMVSPVHTVTEDKTIDDCMALMTQRRIRHLPVLRADALIGVVSIGDIVREVISQKQQTIEEMERYIRGEPE